MLNIFKFKLTQKSYLNLHNSVSAARPERENQNENTYTFYIEESNGEITERTFRRSQVNVERLPIAFKVRQLHNS